jgi:uncharacterized protein YukJ
VRQQKKEKKYGILSTRRLSKRGDNNDINDGNHYVAIKLNKSKKKVAVNDINVERENKIEFLARENFRIFLQYLKKKLPLIHEPLKRFHLSESL